MAARRRPKYQLVCQEIIKRIHCGEWQPGMAIPSLDELENIMPSSRMTILRSLHLLQDQGFLYIMHGRGTFVCRQQPKPSIGILCGDDIFAVPPPPFTAAITQGLRRLYKAAGFEPRLYVVEGYNNTESPYPNHALARDVDSGLLKGLSMVSTNKLPALVADAQGRNMPLTDVGANTELPGHVNFDSTDMLRCAVHWLYTHGRRRLAMLSTDTGHDRVFQEVCDQHGIEKSNQRLISCSTTESGVHLPGANIEIDIEAKGFLLGRRLLQSGNPPDALIVPDDILAKGVAQAMLGSGLNIPDELMMLASGNSGVPVFYPVPIVRYEYDTERIIETVGRHMLAQINQEKPPSSLRIEGQIREYGIYSL